MACYLFIRYDIRITGNKNKYRQVMLVKQKFLCSKGNNHQSEKAMYPIGQNIFKHISSKEIIFKICRDFYNAIVKTKN